MTTHLLSALTTLWLVLAAQPAVHAQAAAATGMKPVPHEALSGTMLDRTVARVQSFFKTEPGGNAIGHFAAARGLSFTFPTQTLHVEDDVARKLAGVKPAVLSQRAGFGAGAGDSGGQRRLSGSATARCRPRGHRPRAR